LYPTILTARPQREGLRFQVEDIWVVGVGVNYRVQSGYGFTRVISASLPKLTPAAQFFYDDLDNQYSDTVPILDGATRQDVHRAWAVQGAAMLDVYNALNSNPVSNFNITNGTQYNGIVATPGSTDGPARRPVGVLTRSAVASRR
jgi:hypothetical protein